MMQLTLKALRNNKNLTQAAAGQLLGVTEDTISNWERGLSYPNVPQIKRIEDLYGVPYSEIIFLPIKSV